MDRKLRLAWFYDLTTLRNEFQVRIREIHVLDKLKYLHCLLFSVLPVVKQIHHEQAFEVELEKKLQGKMPMLLQLKLKLKFFIWIYIFFTWQNLCTYFQVARCILPGQSWMQMSRCAGILRALEFCMNIDWFITHQSLKKYIWQSVQHDTTASDFSYLSSTGKD